MNQLAGTVIDENKTYIKCEILYEANTKDVHKAIVELKSFLSCEEIKGTFNGFDVLSKKDTWKLYVHE